MVFTLPADVDQRPVVIDGAGTLGRRIASVYAAGGSDVRIFDLSADQREAARDYVEEHVAETQQTLGLHPARAGRVEGRFGRRWDRIGNPVEREGPEAIYRRSLARRVKRFSANGCTVVDSTR
jgi:3-hydroxybutyryl-CoA dehydrogenase